MKRTKKIEHTSRVHSTSAKQTMKKSKRVNQNTLSATERKFQHVFETAHDGILLLDAETGVISDSNLTLEKMLGYSHEEILGQKPWDIGLFKYLLASQEAFRDFRKKKGIDYENLPLETKDGRHLDVELTSIFYRVGSQKVVQWDIRDLTERIRTEKALKESEQRFRGIFENTTIGLYRTTPDGRILLANPTLIRMLGYESLQDLTERDLEKSGFEPQYPRDEFREQVEEKGEIRGLEAAWKRKDGTTVFVRESARAVRNEEGKVLYYEGTVEDITERRRVEESLRESEARYRSLFEESPISLWEQDFSVIKQQVNLLRKNGVTDFRRYFESHPEIVSEFARSIKILDVNKATVKLYKAGNKTDLLTNLDRVLVDEAKDNFRNELTALAEGKTEFEGEAVNRTLAGDRLEIHLDWRVAPGFEDTLSKILVSVIDITERRQAEEQVKILSRLPGESPNPILRATSDGILLYANRTSGGLLAMWNTQVGQGFPVEWQERIKKVFDSGLYQEVEVSCEDKVYSLILAPIVDAGYVNLYGRDITLRKQTEQVLAHQTEELRKRNEELDRLYRASGSLLSSTSIDLQSLARTIVDVVLKEFGQANCSLILVRKDSNELVRLAVSGPYADQVKDKKLTLDGPGLVQEAISTGLTVNSNDIHSIPGFIPNWEAAQSELTIPLKVGNRVVGVIDIQSSEPNAFSPDDERLMSVFAERAAMALEHARLYAQTEQRLQNLNSLRTVDMAISSSMDMKFTLGILLEQVINQFGAHAADVLVFDSATQSFRYSTGQGFRTQALQHTDLRLGDGYAGRAARERHIIIIQDLARNTGELQRSAEFSREGFLTYIGIPLIAKGQIKGVLEIFLRSPFDPNQEQLAFLEMLAGQAAIAIDSTQLFEILQVTNSELMMAYDETIEGWSRAMDLRDKDTEWHTQRVTELTLRLANRIGFKGEELVHIRRGALLHDIGKIGVPDEILRKPGPLTDEEWMIMRKHPQLAYDMLAPILYLRPAIDIPHCHHEKWDGTGYPRGLKGEQIPLAARIFAVVDVWDALCSDRPYRKAWPVDKVRSYIQEQAGKQFDPHIVEIFLKEVPSVE